jgi:hypothetical protein
MIQITGLPTSHNLWPKKDVPLIIKGMLMGCKLNFVYLVWKKQYLCLYFNFDFKSSNDEILSSWYMGDFA